jgi:hypothetical protein
LRELAVAEELPIEPAEMSRRVRDLLDRLERSQELFNQSRAGLEEVIASVEAIREHLQVNPPRLN